MSTFRALMKSLPACPGGQAARTVPDVMSQAWAPGARMVVRGYLSVVAHGPPCEGSVPPGGGRHCSADWTLSAEAGRPVEYDDSLPGDLLRLTPDPLPALRDARDGRAAREAGLDVDVTVSGFLPESLCESQEGYPAPEQQTTRVDCAPLSLGLYPLTLTSVCRNFVASPADSAGGQAWNSLAPCDPTSARDAVDAGSVPRHRIGEILAVRGRPVMAPGECTMKACYALEGQDQHRRPLACCNDCDGLWRLRGASEAAGTTIASGAVLVQPPRGAGLLRWAARDCEVEALTRRVQPEVVARGVLRHSNALREGGIAEDAVFVISEATLCRIGE